MAALNEKITEFGVVPVVVLNDANDAKPLADALVEGGLPCAEVTFRTEAAEESIRIMTGYLCSYSHAAGGAVPEPVQQRGRRGL